MKLTALRLWNPCLAANDFPLYLLLVEPVEARPCCAREAKSAHQSLWESTEGLYQFCSEVTLSASFGQRLEAVLQSHASKYPTLANFVVDKAVKVVPISSTQCHLTTVYIACVNERGSRNLVNILDFGGALDSHNLSLKYTDMPTVTNGNSKHDVTAASLVHSSDLSMNGDTRDKTQARFADHVEDRSVGNPTNVHFLKSLDTKSFVADAMSLAVGQMVIFVRFKKVSPRGFEEEALLACSMVIKDFLGCIVADEGVLSAFARWARTRLARQADRYNHCSPKVQVLSADEAKAKFSDSDRLDLYSMQLGAICLFHAANVHESTLLMCMPAAEQVHDQQELPTRSINPAYEGESSNKEATKESTAIYIESKLPELPGFCGSNFIVKNTFIDDYKEQTDDEQPVITRAQTAPAFENSS